MTPIVRGCIDIIEQMLAVFEGTSPRRMPQISTFFFTNTLVYFELRHEYTIQYSKMLLKITNKPQTSISC